MRFTVSLRREAAANTRTPSEGSTKGNASDRPPHTRANKPNQRGMVMRGQGIPVHHARPERAPMRHPTQNLVVGMKSLYQRKNGHERNLGRAGRES